ncbi:WAT1-related protein [Vigna angularis]|uniref:WAT1-related protein n=1 Tax=Phaseolus angularis TaxID=3914 RepID=A0A8T0JYB1_PHAAN|nr:WAT1-related protein [Vigna angularis]
MKLKEVGCLAKMIGTVVSLGGAFLMALYKGPILNIAGSSATNVGQPENVNDPSGNHWLTGACFLLIGCAGFSAFYILQTITLRKYPAEMSLATWVCFLGALQSGVLTIFMERNTHVWSVGWDSRILAYAYSGIVTSAIQFYVQGMVIKTTGPVFVTAFNPLRMIIVTALACIVLSEKLHLGSIMGGAVVVVGLYLVVWGKSKEQKKHSMPASPEKETLQRQQQLPLSVLRSDDNNNNKPQMVIIGDKNHDMEEGRTVNIENQQHIQQHNIPIQGCELTVAAPTTMRVGVTVAAATKVRTTGTKRSGDHGGLAAATLVEAALRENDGGGGKEEAAAAAPRRRTEEEEPKKHKQMQ